MADEPKMVVATNNIRKDAEWRELEERIRERTPARLMEGRSGASYRTATQLQLRADHAAARDAVQAELDLIAHLRAGVSVALGNLRGIDGGELEGRVSAASGAGETL